MRTGLYIRMEIQFMFEEPKPEGPNGATPGPGPLPTRESKQVRHMLLGEPEVVQRCINILHVLGYAEATAWSRPQPADRVGEIVRVLIKTVIVER